MKSNRTSAPLPARERGRLRVVVDRLGLGGAAEALGVGLPTLTRALAACDIRRSSATAITLSLDRLETEAAA